MALQWAMVLFGIFYKSLSRRSIPAVSLTIYLIMGWTVVFFFPLFWNHASTGLLIFIALGGVLYTVGAWFYARKGFRYHQRSPATKVSAHLLVPADKTPKTLRVNGAETPFALSIVGESRYVDVVATPRNGTVDFEVLY